LAGANAGGPRPLVVALDQPLCQIGPALATAAELDDQVRDAGESAHDDDRITRYRLAHQTYRHREMFRHAHGRAAELHDDHGWRIMHPDGIRSETRHRPTSEPFRDWSSPWMHPY